MLQPQTSFQLISNLFPKTNVIDNSNFDFWRRGTTQTANGCLSSDRWLHTCVGTTQSISRLAFNVGDIFPNGVPCPKYACRSVITTVAGAGNFAYMYQRIMYPKILAGSKVTLSFYAKADSNKNMAIEFVHEYGTGGSPTAFVGGIGAQLIALTPIWKKYTVVVSLPAHSASAVWGTTIPGSLTLTFWFDCGTSNASRSASLGQQSGTFDITGITLMQGVHSNTDLPIPKPRYDDLYACNRFYHAQDFCITRFDTNTNTYGGNGGGQYMFPFMAPPYHYSPTIQFYTSSAKTTAGKISVCNNSILAEQSAASYVASAMRENAFLLWLSTALTIVGDYANGYFTLDYEW